MSALMSSDELDRLRDDISAYTLPDTCAILSVTRTSDGQGGWTDAWGTAYASVKCRIDGMVASTHNATIHGQALRDYDQWIITLPHDAVVSTSSRIVHSGNTYNVVSLREDSSWQAHVRAILERV